MQSTRQTKVKLGWEDEQDFEMMGETLFNGNRWNKPGMSILNYEPKTGAKTGAFVPFPAGLDPTADFHTYSISWFPSTSSSNPGRLTEYRFDGELIGTPSKGASINPSNLIINHWTNASPMWSVGPPLEDAVLTIRKVTAYFDKPLAIAAGTDVIKDAACSAANACRVTA
ncbi:hypothetical protein QFC24_006126 [Naganishia onofrii]|uniref:Uncharacterized protein n=1 Tax=Naganishia onofrii TaxID=1851511 RepID=A0ACC2X381_9TREE|nr:hypothetical protein QFC24_006126 [Naganishia onofrii]